VSAAADTPAVDYDDYRQRWRRVVAAGEQATVPIEGTPPPRFPDTCPACLAHADSWLLIERTQALEVSDGESHSTDRSVVGHRVAFCRACVARHREESPPANPWTPLKRLLGGGEGIAGAFIVGIGLFFVLEALKDLSLLLLLFSLLPLTVGGLLMRQTWRANHHLSVTPETSVIDSVSWTALLSLDYEPAWRAFRFRHAAYAERFRAANAERLWNPRGAEALTAKRRRARREHWMKVLGPVVIGALVLWWLFEIVAPLLGWGG
jgi:hypothetical protein